MDILQPDVCAAGGISECKKIADMASAFGIRVNPHVWGTGVALAASLGRTRIRWIPAGPGPRRFATAAALAEMAGDKMLFAPDRRIPPSFAARLAIGAVGGVALARRDASPLTGALAGMAGAVTGTLLGRAARGASTRSGADWARGLAEDAMAAGLATALVCLAERRSRASPSAHLHALWVRSGLRAAVRRPA